MGPLALWFCCVCPKFWHIGGQALLSAAPLSYGAVGWLGPSTKGHGLSQAAPPSYCQVPVMLPLPSESSGRSSNRPRSAPRYHCTVLTAFPEPSPQRPSMLLWIEALLRLLGLNAWSVFWLPGEPWGQQRPETAPRPPNLRALVSLLRSQGSAESQSRQGAGRRRRTRQPQSVFKNSAPL